MLTRRGKDLANKEGGLRAERKKKKALVAREEELQQAVRGKVRKAQEKEKLCPAREGRRPAQKANGGGSLAKAPP